MTILVNRFIKWRRITGKCVNLDPSLSHNLVVWECIILQALYHMGHPKIKSKSNTTFNFFIPFPLPFQWQRKRLFVPRKLQNGIELDMFPRVTGASFLNLFPAPSCIKSVQARLKITFIFLFILVSNSMWPRWIGSWPLFTRWMSLVYSNPSFNVRNHCELRT